MEQHGIIPDEWLVAYAAGALSEAKSTLVATHVNFHPALKNKVSEAEAIGGAMLEDAGEASISDGLLDRVLNSIDEGQAAQAPQSPDATDSAGGWVPQPLADYLSGKPDAIKWRYMGPGMRQAKLMKGENGERLWLLKVKGGTEMPVHGHNGQEMTLVLKGSYHVGSQKFGVGDLEIACDSLEDHQPMIDDGEDCICLVVTEAPIKLSNPIARLMQPFIGL